MVARAWEWLRRKKPLVDAFFALPVVAFTLPSLLGGTSGLGPVRYLLLSAGLIAPLVLRRTFPRAVFVAVVLVSGVQCLLGVIPVPANLAVLMVLYTITANYTFRWGVAAVLVVEAGSVMATVRYPSGAQDRRFTFIMLTVMVAGVYILGLHMRTRRAYLRSVEERAARLELERDNEVRMAMAAERARIARELHDVVAHNVSVIVVQADGAAYAIDTDVGRARQALDTISSTGRMALAEMRRLLGVLRETDDAGAFAPQPGVAQLDDLVEQVRASGLTVSYEVEGTRAVMSEGRQLTVYRIVQEALTNTLKHGGPRVNVSVRLRYAEDALEIRVEDDGRGAAASNDGRGHGLAGMRERVAVYGGSVRMGPRAGGGFEVVASVPVREEVAA
ncbi:sensor histidine kinase [Actinomadura madurae]|uniref:sensor histidine kinase n=1 Tax=Actinomadura madurae TaxID=1993 RepID=UPI0020261D96|nr:sensor histidine kinase [Actinomadura madurae]MCP9952768.1 sensor histidine kinase [Actinomadura madurae]MCP9969531.1 sensor histidine kinase [Actinomadura madurae]MCP9981985.1 sensor histidine kinase [Actinomadura madurae]MCQ0006484.1 sensor histidine kinase [Actinomadura madurae]MCQ0018224.1 sensor histidine kinase [Actinomadura madurae]